MFVEENKIQEWNFISPPLTPGRKLLNSATYTYPTAFNPPAYAMYYQYYPEKRFMTTNEVTGFIDILRVDTTNGSIEARFEFDGEDISSGERIKITNGYFKLR
jgi:hypothetical protein